MAENSSAKETARGVPRGFGSVARVLLATGTVALLGSLLFGPSLIQLVEDLFNRGADIEIVLRAYFTIATYIAVVGLLFLLISVGLADSRSRVVAYALAATGITLLGLWILNRGVEFASEISNLTFFSTMILILTAVFCSLKARLLYIRQEPASAIAFWALLGLGFFGAGFDENFQGHEAIAAAIQPVTDRVGIAPGIVQDGVTAAYAVGAVVVLLAFQAYFRGELLKRGVRSGWILLVGIACFGFSVFNDSFDFVADFLWPQLHPPAFMNFLEEVLEFVAANLFLSAALVAIMETEGDAANQLFAPDLSRSRPARFAIYGVMVLSAVGLVGLRLAFPPIGHVSTGTGTSLEVFADVHDGLDDVDQLFFDPKVGLLAGNEATSSILRFDMDGSSRTWVDAGSGLVEPDGIALHNGEIIVADDANGRVLRFGLDGQMLGEISGNWDSPEGVASAGGHGLYVADSGLSVVVRLGADWQARPVATRFEGLRDPEQLAVDSRGQVYVTDEVAQAVFKIGPQGAVEKFLGVEDGLDTPESIAVHEDRIYVLDSRRSAILSFDRSGSGGVFVQFAKRYRDPQGLAFGPNGELWVSIGSDFRPHNFILRVIR